MRMAVLLHRWEEEIMPTEHETFRAAFMAEFQRARDEVAAWPAELRAAAAVNHVLVKSRDDLNLASVGGRVL